VRLFLVAGLLLLLGLTTSARAASPFADWAAIVVAGDYRAAHEDVTTEAFDNARRDVSLALERKGFAHANLRQFSVRPERYGDTKPLKSDLRPIYETLRDLAAHAPGGCLVYFTSHGAPQGVVLGDNLLPPGLMDEFIGEACGKRPTVVIISACYSGVFVPVLAEPNRMILTAARPDRSSFGCSENNKYPFFDDCVLQTLPAAHDFVALADQVKTCVARREQDEGMRPPSEPQVSVGVTLRPVLPLFVFPPG
jgi:hypothetical protein